MRKQLHAYILPAPVVEPVEMVAVMDCVFFGRSHGYLVVRDPNSKCNVCWSEIKRESIDEYQCARDTLESLGFVLRAVATDGKPGIRPIFAARCVSFT